MASCSPSETSRQVPAGDASGPVPDWRTSTNASFKLVKSVPRTRIRRGIFRRRFLGCPFSKFDGVKYGSCSLCPLDTMSRVGQHLYRVHRCECPACLGASRTHFTDTSCTGAVSIVRLESALQVLVNSRPAETEEQWFKVFETIFPGHARPQTPFYKPAEVLRDVSTAGFEPIRGEILREVDSRLHTRMPNPTGPVPGQSDSEFQRCDQNHPSEVGSSLVPGRSGVLPFPRLLPPPFAQGQRSILNDNSTFIDSGVSVVSHERGDAGNGSGSGSFEPAVSRDMDLNYLIGLHDKLHLMKRMEVGLQQQIDDFLDGREDIRKDYMRATGRVEEMDSQPATPSERHSSREVTAGINQDWTDESDAPQRVQSTRSLNDDQDHDNDDDNDENNKSEQLSGQETPLSEDGSASSDSQSVSSSMCWASQAGSAFSDMLWLTRRSELVDLPQSHPFLTIETVAVDKVVASFHAWLDNPRAEEVARAIGDICASSGSGSSSTSLASGSTLAQRSNDSTPRSSSQNGTNPNKRKRADDDDPTKLPIKSGRKRVEEGSRRLACPFQKRYPLKHLRCGTRGDSPGFDTIAHVKGHLKRRHIRGPNYCPRCKAEFDTAHAKDEHILRGMTSQRCDLRPFRDETALSWDQDVMRALHERVNKALTLHEQWFAVWDIIFPGISRPPTCIIDEDLCGHVLEYQAFISSDGLEIVRSVIQDSGPTNRPGGMEGLNSEQAAEMGAFAERIFELAAPRIFENWISQRREPDSQHQPHPGPMTEQTTRSLSGTIEETPDRALESGQRIPTPNTDAGYDLAGSGPNPIDSLGEGILTPGAMDNDAITTSGDASSVHFGDGTTQLRFSFFNEHSAALDGGPADFDTDTFCWDSLGQQDAGPS